MRDEKRGSIWGINARAFAMTSQLSSGHTKLNT